MFLACVRALVGAGRRGDSLGCWEAVWAQSGPRALA